MKRLLLIATLCVVLCPAVGHAQQMGSGWYWPTGTDDFGKYWGFWASYKDAKGVTHWHLGQDMIRNQGQPVFSLGNGEVVASGDFRGFGSSHDYEVKGGAMLVRYQAGDGAQFTALYGHLQDYRTSGTVEPGEVIGHVNGYDPDHLHFGIHPGGDVATEWYKGWTTSSGNNYGFTDPIPFLDAHPRKVVPPPPTDWKAQWVSQNWTDEPWPVGQARFCQVRYKNVGTRTWQKNTVHLSPYRSDLPHDRIPSLIRGDQPGGSPSLWIAMPSPPWERDWPRVEWLDAKQSCAPGDEVSFQFWFTIPWVWSPGGVYDEPFCPVADDLVNGGWMDQDVTHFIFRATDKSNAYDGDNSRYAGQNHPGVVYQGQKVALYVQFQNTFPTTWWRTGRYHLHLGFYPEDIPASEYPQLIYEPVTGFTGNGNRVLMNEDRVGNGQTARFDYTIRIPASTTPRSYRHSVGLVSDDGEGLCLWVKSGENTQEKARCEVDVRAEDTLPTPATMTFAPQTTEPGASVGITVHTEDPQSGIASGRIGINRAADGSESGEWSYIELPNFTGDATATWDTTGWALGRHVVRLDSEDGFGHHQRDPQFVYTLQNPVPTVVSATYVDATHVKVLFSEALDATTSAKATNYVLAPSVKVSAAALQTDKKTVLLTTAAQAASTTYKVTVSGVKDAAGVLIGSTHNTARWKTPNPPPTVASTATWVNNSRYIRLVFSEALDQGTAETAANYLVPGLTISRVRLLSDTKTVQLTTSFQAASTTYKVTVSGVKEAGGVLIGATHNTASWKTPNPAPRVASTATWVNNSSYIRLVFNEPLDQGTAETAANYVVPGLTISRARLLSDTKTVQLTTSFQAEGTTYTATVSNVKEVGGVLIGATHNTASWKTPNPAPKVDAAATWVNNSSYIRLVFSEALDQGTAETAANYVVPGLTISRARLLSDTKTVQLTTSFQAEGTTYTATVSGVKEAGGVLIGSTHNTASWTALAIVSVVSAHSPTGTNVGVQSTVISATFSVPTASGAQIVLNLASAADVSVTVRNLAGREVATLQPGALIAGVHSLLWNGRSRTGTKCPSGTYLVQVRAHAADGTTAQALTSLPLR